MPAPVYLSLTPAQDADLLRLSRSSNLDARTRARLEAVRLSAQRWPVPRIAAYLGLNPATVRRAFDRFSGGGLDALLPLERPRLEPTIRGEVRDALKALLEANAALTAPRALTAPILAEALKEKFGTVFHRETVRVALKRLGYSFKRTRYVTAKPPDPEAYAQSAERLEGL